MSSLKQLEITMPDGSIWAVPVSAIIESRVSSACRGGKQSRDAARAQVLKDFDAQPYLITIWARRCIDWQSVASCAVRINPPTVDYTVGWQTGPMRLAPLSPELVGFEQPGA